MPFLVDLATEAGLAAAILLYLVGWVVCLGLLYTYDATFHFIFTVLARALTINVLGQRFHLGKWITDVDTFARNALSDWAIGCEIMVGKLMYAMGWTIAATISELAALSGDVNALGKWLVHTAIPTYVHGVTDVLHAATKTVGASAAAAARAAQLAIAKSEAQVATLEHDAEVARADAEAAAREAVHAAKMAGAVVIPQAIAHPIPVVLPGVSDLPIPWGRTVRQIRRRLRAVEGLFAASVFAAAMANVLGIPSWRCLTKGPIGRVSRALCGLGSHALNDLLGLLVDALIITDVCDVIALLDQALPYVLPLVEDFVAVADMALCHGDFPAVPDDPPVTLSLPPVTGLVLSLP